MLVSTICGDLAGGWFPGSCDDYQVTTEQVAAALEFAAELSNFQSTIHCATVARRYWPGAVLSQ